MQYVILGFIMVFIALYFEVVLPHLFERKIGKRIVTNEMKIRALAFANRRSNLKESYEHLNAIPHRHDFTYWEYVCPWQQRLNERKAERLFSLAMNIPFRFPPISTKAPVS